MSFLGTSGCDYIDIYINACILIIHWGSLQNVLGLLFLQLSNPNYRSMRL